MHPIRYKSQGCENECCARIFSPNGRNEPGDRLENKSICHHWKFQGLELLDLNVHERERQGHATGNIKKWKIIPNYGVFPAYYS